MFSVRYEGCPRIQEDPFVSQDTNPAVLAEVDRIWSESQAEHDSALINGSIFSVKDIVGPLITGCFVDYKYFFVACRHPKLFADLQVRPLAVTGLCRCEGEIILGRRSVHVTQDPGLWEFVPSGGIDRSSQRVNGSLDIASQISQELLEETGLKPALIESVSPRYVIEDTSSHVFDVVADVILNPPAKEVKDALDQTRSPEIDDFQVLDSKGIKSFFKDHQRHIASMSRYLVEDLDILSSI